MNYKQYKRTKKLEDALYSNCFDVDEDSFHLYNECPVAKRIYTLILKLFTKCTEVVAREYFQLLVLSQVPPTAKKYIKELIPLLATARYVIFKVKQLRQQPTSTIAIKSIAKTQLQVICRVHLLHSENTAFWTNLRKIIKSAVPTP